MFLFVFVLIPFCIPQKAAFAASGTYSISQININASVNESGDMSVTEDYTYLFTGSFNGIKRDIETNGSAGLYDVSVQVAKGSEIETPKFEINNINNGKEIKIYSASKNETKDFIINYKIKNVVTKYSDLAELKWIFYKNESNVTTNKATVYLSLPKNIDSSVKYSGEGPKRGTISLDGNNRIKLQLNDLGDNDIIGASVTFPPTWINSSRSINMSKASYDTMIKRQKIIKALAIVVLLALIVGLILIVIYTSGRKRRNAIKAYRENYVFYNGEYYSELPSNLPPEFVAMLMDKVLGINELMASILNLANKGVINFNQDPISNHNYKMLCFTINTHIQDYNLYESEHYLVTWLKTYCKNNLVYLSDIKDNADKSKFSDKFTEWKNITQKETNTPEFHISILGKSILTNKYEDERIKWLAFKSYLRDSNHTEFASLKLNTVMPYAIVLNESATMLKNLKQYNIYDDISLNNNIFINYWFLNYFTCMYYEEINKHYNDYVNNSDNNNTNSFNNFSDGSGGGFGGGGGSSAF
ncbi:DUF2207 domain-containing protein [Clostridium acidisoli]|uniref:DUF2207 domain-containing protein n=1 Tax=Clostridium acidisoli TaxID=91624 RepID=UPI001A9A2DCB|nr:DUF2207 domain-containing protein [Clostridium acidisoli]